MTALDLICALANVPRNATVVVRNPEGFYGAVASARPGNLVLGKERHAEVVIIEERPLCEAA